MTRPKSALLGRDVELARLAYAVDTADRLLVFGEPGIGKSSLLGATADHAHDRGHRVLTISGVEAEADLPFAGLHQLLRPIQRTLRRLPDGQQHALRAAFGSDEATAPDAYLIALAALNLLATAAADRPICVVLDDVHWLDQPTHEALAFIARHLEDLPVSLVGAARQGYPGPLLEAGLPTLHVRGLAEDVARQLLHAHAADLDTAAVREILAESLGNPLALVELPAAWPQRDQSTGDLPLTARLERAFAGRVAQLATPARNLLLVMAVAHSGDRAELLAAATALTGRPVGDGALAEATAARLVANDPLSDAATISFHHPLVRSGIIQSESLTRRQAAHAALAEILVDDSYRRAWHRAMSIVGPDDGIADELSANADISVARGAAGRAVAELERAAQLTTDPARRGHRLLLAAQNAFTLGQVDTVSRLVQEATRGDLDELDWARVEWLREIFHDGTPGDAIRVLELCNVAHKAYAAADTDLALNLLLGAGLRCWWADTGPAARARCAAAIKQLDASDDPRWVAALACAEPVLEAAAVSAVLDRSDWTGETDGDRLRLLGIAAHAIGDTERAADLMDGAQTALRDTGRLGLLPHVLGIYNHLLVELGELAKAEAVVTEASRLAAETHQPVWTAGTLSTGGRLLAFQGRPRRAAEMAEQAMKLAGRINDQLCVAVLAIGAAHLAAGRYEEAFHAHARLFEPTDPAYHWREAFAGVGTLAESAVGADRVAEARVILARLEEVAGITPAPLLRVHLGYARAVLADDADAECRYRDALSMPLTRWPFVRGRLDLAYGEWLLRQGRTVEAFGRLRSADKTLEEIGAVPWTERARRAIDGASTARMR
ncbi:AAA family ATPase [Hamadaea tsunoensis]|uniref:AAA family ATPase n=1 Tax=Hamadaea tsunoensis TaxID=53368 RepID=UPI000424CF2F|nr:AAA family ATPase [Hamadaea tsunoensis]